MSGRSLCSVSFLILLLSLSFQDLVEAQAAFKTASNYKAERYGSRHVVRKPRGITYDGAGNLLIISQGSSQISLLYEENNDIKSVAVVEARKLSLNHGIAYSKNFLYASNDTAVFRWKYNPGQKSKITTEPEVVVSGIPGGGDYRTRSLVIDGSNYLYVSVGASENIISEPNRAVIRRFNLAENIPSRGFSFESEKNFVSGVRNAVGLAVDGTNSVWGVDCSADQLKREDLGTNIENTNPADELIKFEQGLSYGYPKCWTVGQLAGHQPGDQFAWENSRDDDTWCKDTKNNRPPTLALPAHNAPLGIAFYDGVNCDISGAFPCSMKGDAFLAFHGSSDAESLHVGYKVARLPFNSETGLPTGEIEDILFDSDPSSCAFSPTTCLRPVDLVFNDNGRLIVTSDTSDELFRIEYKSKGSLPDVIKQSLHIPGIVALVIVIIVTVALIGAVSYKFCCFCRKNDNVPYTREQI